MTNSSIIFVLPIQYSLIMNYISLHKNNFISPCKDESENISESVNYTANERMRQAVKVSRHLK